jgi:hypothetical protein
MLVFEKELSSLEAGSHLCAATVTHDECHEAIAAFLLDGMRRGEHCLLVAPKEQQAAVCGLLGQTGVSTATLLIRGAFVLRDPREVYAPDGKFDVKRSIELARRSIVKAHELGFHAYRAAGSAGSAFRDVDIAPAALASYEAGITDLMQTTHSLALCAFDRPHLGNDHLSVMLQTHPLALLGGRLCHNPFCDPPSYSQGVVGTAQKINWMINQILHSENSRRDLGAMNHALIREAAALSIRLDQHRQREDNLQRALEARNALLELVNRWLSQPMPQLFAKLQSVSQDERSRFAAGAFDACGELLAGLQRLAGGLQAALVAPSAGLCPDETDLVPIVSEAIAHLPGSSHRKNAVIRLAAPGRLVGWWDRTVLSKVVHALVEVACEQSLGLPIDLCVDDRGPIARLSLEFHLPSPPRPQQPAVGCTHESGRESPHDQIDLAIWPLRETIRQMGGSFGLSTRDDAHVLITVELPRVATSATPAPFLQ